MDVGRLAIWLVFLTAIFVPLERLCALHPAKIWRKQIGVDLAWYFINSLFPAAILSVPLALVAQTPFVLVVNPELPVHSIAELIQYAKQQAGKLSYATAGVGTPHHLFAELLKSMTGIDMSPVGYRGSLPALNDVIAGHVPLMFVDLGPALGIIQAGKVRPLGVSTRTRLAVIPDVPPLADVGVPGFDAASWQMIVAPAKTPRPIVDQLHDELKALVGSAEIKDRILEEGMVPMDDRSVADLHAFVVSEIARWGKVVRQAGLEGSQ